MKKIHTERRIPVRRKWTRWFKELWNKLNARPIARHVHSNQAFFDRVRRTHGMKTVDIPKQWDKYRILSERKAGKARTW